MVSCSVLSNDFRSCSSHVIVFSMFPSLFCIHIILNIIFHDMHHIQSYRIKKKKVIFNSFSFCIPFGN